VKRFLYITFVASVLSVLRVVFFQWLLISSKQKVRSADFRTRDFGRNQLFYLRDFLLWSPHWMLTPNSFLARSLMTAIDIAAEAALLNRDASPAKINNWRIDLCKAIGLGHLLTVQEEVVEVSKPILQKSPIAPKPIKEPEAEESVVVPVRLSGDMDIHS
jgi:hypothetical protein